MTLRRLCLSIVGFAIAAGAICGSRPAIAQPEQNQPVPAEAAAELQRLIYLPYKNLKAVLDNEKAAVFMPYGDFLKLWEAYRPQGAESKPPVGAVLTQANYTGTVEKDVAKLTADLTIQVLGKPWVELPVQFGDAAIGKITSAENKILLQATGNGKYVFLLPAAGEHKVQLELVARVHTSPDGRSLEFAVPPASVTNVDLTVPAADQAVELSGSDPAKGGVVEPVEAENKEITHVKAQLGATERISARWRPRVSTAPAMELLATVQTVQDVRVADGLVHTHATLTYQVQRGQLDQLRILVPVSHRVLDVTSPNLKSWKATAEEKQQVLVVDLLSNDAKNVVVQVHTERPAPSEAFPVAGIADDGTVHGIHAVGGVRETGLVALSQSADLTLAVEKQTGLVRVEAAEAPETLRRPESQFYRYFSPKFDLQVSTKPVEPRVLVTQATELTFDDDELRLQAALQYTIERAGLFELRLKVPEGLVIDRVDCEAMKEFQAPAGQNLLIVVLKERMQGSLAMNVAGHQPLDPAAMGSQKLPLLEPQNVARETGTIRVLAPEAIEVVTDEQGLQGAQPSRDETAAQNQQAGLPGNLRLASAWTYSRRPVEIPVTTTRKPTRLSAGIGTLIDVRQDVVAVTTTIQFNVEYAGIDTFRLAVPKSVADSVQIESGNPGAMPIKQKQRDDGENEWVTWTVVFQRELTGNVPLIVRYDLRPERKDMTTQLSIAPIRVLASPGQTAAAEGIPVSSLTGEISVQKDRALSIAAEAKDMEPIDVRDLTMLSQDGYLAFRYYRQPEKLDEAFAVSLTATQHELKRVADTVVSKAAIEAVVTEESSVLYRARFLLKSSERQRLPISLPREAQLLDAQVAGKKVDLEVQPNEQNGDWQPYFVNVARTTQSNEPFTISVVFRAPYREKLLKGRTGGPIQLVLPKIGANGENATDVPVLEVRAAVWVPREYDLVGKPDDFTPVRQSWIHFVTGVQSSVTSTAEDLDNWMGGATGGLFDFTPAGHAFVYQKLGSADYLNVTYWPMVAYTWVLSVAVALIGMVLAWTTWENRLTVALLVVFLGVLGALYDADLALHLLAVARWGLVAALAFWVLRGLSRPAKPSDVDFRIQGAPLAAVIPPPDSFGTKPARPEPAKSQ